MIISYYLLKTLLFAVGIFVPIADCSTSGSYVSHPATTVNNCRVSDDLSKIVNMLPAETNTLSIVDFSALDNSQWAKRSDVAIGDLVEGTQDMQKVVFASDLDFDYLDPQRQFAFVTYSEPVDLSKTMDSANFRIDSIANHKLMWLEGRIVVIAVNDQTLAVFPAQGRQSAARWIRTHLDEPDEERASIFLRYAATQAAKQNHLFVLAMDLRDVVSPKTIRTKVFKSQMFEGGDRQAATTLLAGVEGVVLTIRATESLQARLQVRFDDSAEILEGQGIKLVDSILRSIGAKLKDMDNWQSNIDHNVVTLFGPLHEDTFEDIVQLAVFDSQIPVNLRLLNRRVANTKSNTRSSGSPGKNISKNASEKPTSAERSSVATAEFLESMQRLLQSLNSKCQDNRLADSRFWLDRYAFKIQYLNRENVDSDLLEFADQTTRRLRAMAETLENALLEAAEEFESGWTATPTWQTVNYGGVRIRRRAYFYGGAGWGNDRQEVDRLQARDAINDASVKVKSEGISIVRDYNDIGQRLAAKYDFEFERWTPGNIR